MLNKIDILARDCQSNYSKESITKLIEAMQPTIAAIMYKMNVPAFMKCDILQECNLAILEMIYKWECGKGRTFQNYAAIFIHSAVVRYSLNNRTQIKATTSLSRKAAATTKMSDFDTRKEYADFLGISLETLDKNLLYGEISTAVNENGVEVQIYDLLEQTAQPSIVDQVIHDYDLDALNNALEALRPTLTDAECYILENRLLSSEPAIGSSVALRLQLSKQCVYKIERELKQKIKDRINQRNILSNKLT